MELYAAGVLAYPRKINLLKTQHFDILYPDESTSVALYIADNAENFYAQAQYTLETENNIRMPVVISPDSDQLYISYSSYPYNRLLVFHGVPSNSQLGFEDVFGSMLYREIFLAVAQSKMSPFNQIIHDTLGGEKYTPVSLFNLPASFVEGYGYLIESQFDYHKINDNEFLKLLSEAKFEGKFPSWFQIFATRDTYPGEKLSYAAGTAFVSFLIQSRGVEKYAELWEECGKLHPFFAAGIIYKVYGTKISKLWKEFQDAIPMPAEVESVRALEEEVEKLFIYTESNYNHLVYSDFGVIWYDDLRHEVDIYDFRQKTIYQKKLFAAEGVQKLSVSPDGRYLSLSFVQSKRQNSLTKNITWIYDLLEETFLEDEYKLRDASIINLKNGKNAIAGINIEEKIPKLQIYTSRNFGSQKNELIFEKIFFENEIPFSPVYSGYGTLMYILSAADKTTVNYLDFSKNEEKRFSISTLDEIPLRINNLVYQNAGLQLNEQELYTFQYTDIENNSFTRTGSFVLDGGVPDAVSLQSIDLAGGVNYPVYIDNTVVFASQKLYHNELEILPFQKLNFQPGMVTLTGEGEFVNQLEKKDEKEEFDLSEYDISKYSLLTYWHRFSIVPFIPIKDISFAGADSAIGLGALLKLVPDPFMNNKLTVSASWSFLNLDFVWMLNTPEDEKKIIDKTEKTVSKDKTFAFFYENTSTPLDIKAGALFRCNLDGEYEFEALSGISWTMPLGFTFNQLKFDVYGLYEASTEYYDPNQAALYGPKNNFPSFQDAYELVTLSGTASFSNMHQYGSSSFAQKGFSAGVNLYSVWDIFKYRNSEETNPYVSQMFLGFKGSFAVPQLIPVKPNEAGWILGLPSSWTAEFSSKAGIALATNAEILLIGKEVQNGISYLNFYCNRIGLKFGHDFALKYDTYSIPLPDFRRFDYVFDILSNSKPSNSFYLLLNLDFLFPIGPLSQRVIHSKFKTTFYPDTQGFTFNLDFSLNF